MMQINRRVTNGLAWAGLLLVVGVPSADLISAQLMDGEGAGRAAVISTPVLDVSAPPRLDAVPETAEAPQPVETDPVETDPVETASITGDPVDNFVQGGRELPSYITEGGNPAPLATAPSTRPAAPADGLSTTTVSRPETQTAMVSPAEKIAPVPMPASMRPPSVARSTVPMGMAPNALGTVATVPPATVPGTAPTQSAPATASSNGELFFPQSVQPRQQPQTAAVAPSVAPAPVVNPAPVVPPADVGDADYYGPEDLEGWESGPLSEFLAQRAGGQGDFEDGYDEDGFYLDEGPESSASFERRFEDAEIVTVYPLY